MPWVRAERARSALQKRHVFRFALSASLRLCVKKEIGRSRLAPHGKEETMHITVVGLGPGDPELITVKGMRAIQTADVIFVPQSRASAGTGGGEGTVTSLALRIAEPWIDTDRQTVIELDLPMTRDTARLSAAWRAAADQIASRLAEQGAVARGVYLLLGDPLLYGTFTSIWGELLNHHPTISVAFIPGITSFAAAAAHTQTTLATTTDRVAILPASSEIDNDELRRVLTDFDTVILMKVGTVLPHILPILADLDRLDHAVYAEHVGLPGEYITHDLRTLQGQQRPYLSLVIVRR